MFFSGFFLFNHSCSFSALPVVLDKTSYCDPWGQAAYASQQTAVGDLQQSTTKYCLQTHLVEKWETNPIALCNKSKKKKRSAENGNCILHPDELELYFE